MTTDLHEATGEPRPDAEDRELRDEHARSTARPGWFAVIVVLDVLAIVAFLAWVVVPRFT